LSRLPQPEGKKQSFGRRHFAAKLMSKALPFPASTATMATSAGDWFQRRQDAMPIRHVSAGEGKMDKVRDPGQVKPGWTTTEFWQTVFVHAIAAVVALGTVIHTNFNLNGLQAIVPAIALVASAIAQSVYSHSRATVKASAQAAGAQVKSEDQHPGIKVAGAEPVPIVVQLTGLERPVNGHRGEELAVSDR
jgi:hypothetical protein